MSEQSYFEQFIGDNEIDAQPSKSEKWVVSCYGQVSVFDTPHEALAYFDTIPASWYPRMFSSVVLQGCT